MESSGRYCRPSPGHSFFCQMVALYPGDVIVSTGKYFTRSFEKKAEFTEKIVAEEVRRNCWNDLFPTGIEQETCIEAVFAERNVQARVRQGTSDEFRARKRRARDTLFNGLGYQHLQSRFVVHSELEKVAKAEELVLVKAKMLRKRNQ